MAISLALALHAGCQLSAKRSEEVATQSRARINRSIVFEPGVHHMPDLGGGAIRIEGDGLVVDFAGAEIVGANDDTPPDQYTGTGLFVHGRNIVIKNASVRGYKVGIWAENCPGLLVEDVDVSGNYRQHLSSLPQSEDSTDWLYPHDNDENQWVEKHGAGLYVKSSDFITVRRVRARRCQNGIILDRVNHARIYDNDCSFLSGWGLAMWRCNKNVITRNAFDFCIRGYSHDVYNRGQDSAGILMFEQNSDNVIADNSATHCGDGLFGFGGQASLQTAGRTGNNANIIAANDFSYAAAHGIEMTFSFDNQIVGNNLVGNAICGLWGGYSQNTIVAFNTITDNGAYGYGLERGGVNIEHGYRNRIVSNQFADNACGVHMWTDADPQLTHRPWIRANERGSAKNVVAFNSFDGDAIAIQLRQCSQTCIHPNVTTDVGLDLQSDDTSQATLQCTTIEPADVPNYPMFGETRPVGARAKYAGLENILMTEWGPHDFEGVALWPTRPTGGESTVVRMQGIDGEFSIQRIDGQVTVEPPSGTLPGELTVHATDEGLLPFTIDLQAKGRPLTVRGTLLSAQWNVRFYEWNNETDPRSGPEAWARLMQQTPAAELTTAAIDFRWGGHGPSPDMPSDHWATVAKSRIELPAGQYRVETISDDGVRVLIDGDVVLENWTWHPPTGDAAEVTLQGGKHEIRVAHFEIDGHAELRFNLTPIGGE